MKLNVLKGLHQNLVWWLGWLISWTIKIYIGLPFASRVGCCTEQRRSQLPICTLTLLLVHFLLSRCDCLPPTYMLAYPLTHPSSHVSLLQLACIYASLEQRKVGVMSLYLCDWSMADLRTNVSFLDSQLVIDTMEVSNQGLEKRAALGSRDLH